MAPGVATFVYTDEDPATFTGSEDTGFDALLAATRAYCGCAGLTIQPSAVTLAPGATQQFIPNREDVTFSATGGTIDAQGLYTAGATAGTFHVRATSLADPGTFAEATVTITAGSVTFIGHDPFVAAHLLNVPGACEDQVFFPPERSRRHGPAAFPAAPRETR